MTDNTQAELRKQVEHTLKTLWRLPIPIYSGTDIFMLLISEVETRGRIDELGLLKHDLREEDQYWLNTRARRFFGLSSTLTRREIVINRICYNATKRRVYGGENRETVKEWFCYLPH